MSHCNELKKGVPASIGTTSVLCVDDEPQVLKALRRVFTGSKYRFFPASCARDGIFLLEQESIDVVISDMRMPEIDGAEFLADVADRFPECGRMLLTGYSDLESTIKAVNAGKIDHYLQKPWNNEELLLCVRQTAARKSLEQANSRLVVEVERQNKQLTRLNSKLELKVQQRTAQIRQALSKLNVAHNQAQDNLDATTRAIYNVISLAPDIGREQAIAVGDLCEALARHFNLNESKQRELRLAGLLHELGLLAVGTEMLSVPYYALNAEGMKEYQERSIEGCTALAPAVGLKRVSLIIRHQYEQVDGQGMPDQLATDDIPVGSRILTVARDYVRAINGRLRKGRLNESGAIAFLSERGSEVYDSRILKALPAVTKSLNHAVPTTNETVVPHELLRPGDKLSRDLFTQDHILLLPAEYRLTEESIRRIQAFDELDKEPLEIFVYEH